MGFGPISLFKVEIAKYQTTDDIVGLSFGKRSDDRFRTVFAQQNEIVIVEES